MGRERRVAEAARGDYGIAWSEAALNDLDALRAYLLYRSPVAARTVVERILASVEALSAFPGIGRIGRVPGTFEKMVYRTPYRVVYRMTADAVHVLAVVHGKRMWPDTFTDKNTSLRKKRRSAR